MKTYPSTCWRARWFTALFVIALIASVAFGGLATGAQTTPTTVPTATPDNSVGPLNTPPPTPVPTATPAPTAVATTPAATLASTTSAPAPTASGTPAAATSPTTSGTPSASTASSDTVDYEEIPNGGGAHNIVKVQNKTDNRLRLKGKIQLNHIPGDNVEPVNFAQAIGSCTDCQTFAVALQIDLRSRTASVVAPQNVAVAANIRCMRCTTVADAYQFVIPVDDPTATPENVKGLINQMQQELKSIAETPGITAAAAAARVNAVIRQFTDLALSLTQQHDEKSDDDTPGATVPADAVVLTPPPDAPQGTTTGTTTPATPTAAP